MSKITKFRKDKKNRDKFFRNELKILVYKYGLFGNIEKEHKQFYLYKFIQRFHLNWSMSRIVNKCLYTGRTRWVIRRYRLSRMMFKNLCDNGKIHGTRRSSW